MSASWIRIQPCRPMASKHSSMHKPLFMRAPYLVNPSVMCRFTPGMLHASSCVASSSGDVTTQHSVRWRMLSGNVSASKGA